MGSSGYPLLQTIFCQFKIIYYFCVYIMEESAKEFLSRLRSPLMVAEEEGISVQAVYKRMNLGKCNVIDICGTRFILNDKK